MIKKSASINKKIVINNSNIRIDYSDVTEICNKILKASYFKKTNEKYPQLWHLASGKITTLKQFIQKYITDNKLKLEIKFNNRKESVMHHISNTTSIWK